MPAGVHTFKSAALHKIVTEAVDHFIKAPVNSFPLDRPFSGGGVYALYYMGDFNLYRPLSLSKVNNDSLPIYIGKAVPAGWRTARVTKASGGRQLYRRINEHFNNIEHVTNLNSSDFQFRCMVLDYDEGGIIGPIEAALIRKFEPLWNTVIDGFGNHTPGEGRFNQAKSGWDVLHPGRKWAKMCMGKAPSHEDLVTKITEYCKRKGSKN